MSWHTTQTKIQIRRKGEKMSSSMLESERQPYWMRRNLSLIRGRNANDEGCYAEILCNYQILAAEAKLVRQAGSGGAVAGGGGGGLVNRRSYSVSPAAHATPNSLAPSAGDVLGDYPMDGSESTRQSQHLDPAAAFTYGAATRSSDVRKSNVLMRTITNFTRGEGSSNSSVAGGGGPTHSDVHATIRELSNELDRAQSELAEKQNIITNLKASRDRLESQVGEQNVKIANASMAAVKLQREAEKREEIISILKSEREGFISENDSLRKKASDALREAEKFRKEIMSWKEVEIGLRQQVFELESFVSEIRRAEAENRIQFTNKATAKNPSIELNISASSPDGGAEGMMDVNEFLSQQQNNSVGNNAKNDNSDFVDVSSAVSASAATPTASDGSNTTKSRFTSFVDNFLAFGKPYNAATNSAALQAEAMQKQLREQETEPNFTAQNAAFLGTDVVRGHQPTSSIPTFASFVVERAHEGDLQALCFTESAKHIWTGGAEKAIKCWDVNANGRMVVRLPCSGGFPLSLNSVGDILAVGCSDATIRVLETSRYRDKCQLTGHSEKVTTALLSPDCLRVFSTATDRTIKKWAVSRELMEQTIMCVSGCNDIAIANDKIASAHHDGTVRIWDCRDCKSGGELRGVHEKAISTVRWVGEGMLIASMGRDDMIKISDIRTMRTIHTIRDPQLRVASNLQRFDISVDGRFLCVGGGNGNLLFFNTDSEALSRGTNNAPRVITGGHAGYIMNVTWNPEGKGVATVGSDKKLAYWR